MARALSRPAFGLLAAANLICLGPASHSSAQQSAEQVVSELNRDAMEAYNALDINKAGSMLEEALRVAQQGGVMGPLLAQTHMNLGVVYIGGLGDQDAGLGSFLNAVCIDPGIQPDPLTSSPDIQSVFAAAMQQARGGACPTGPPPGGPGGPPVPPQAMAPPPDQALMHASPPEQLTQTPLPVYAEINPLARAKEIFLFYKGLGMEKWKRVPMYRYQSGFAYQISCTDVWEPKVSYYIEAHGEGGQVVGAIASSAQPIEVPIVAKRTQGEPALPGATPPASCAAKECPPGLAGCVQPGKAAIGDSCDKNTDCQSGLECRDECVLIGAGGTEVPEYDPITGSYDEPDEPTYDDPKDFKRTFVQAGFVVGFAYVQAGMIADRPPPDDHVFVTEIGTWIPDPITFLSTSPPGEVVVARFPGPDDIDPNTQAPLLARYPWVPDADSEDTIGPLGGTCSPDGKKTGPAFFDPLTGDGLFPSRYCVRVKSAGFVPNPALRLAIGHFVTPEIGISGIFRLQFSAGEGTLANMLLGLRGEYMFTSPRSTGLMLSAFLGGTFGQIQAQPPASGNTEGAPFATSGLMGAHVGANVRYRFIPNFGVYASPEIDVQLPTFLLNVDLTLGGIEGAF